MDKKEFLNSPNITDLIKTIVNKLCSEEVFKSDSKLRLKKYESSMKKINFILVDGLGSKNIENLDNISKFHKCSSWISQFRKRPNRKWVDWILPF